MPGLPLLGQCQCVHKNKVGVLVNHSVVISNNSDFSLIKQNQNVHLCVWLVELVQNENRMYLNVCYEVRVMHASPWQTIQLLINMTHHFYTKNCAANVTSQQSRSPLEEKKVWIYFAHLLITTQLIDIEFVCCVTTHNTTRTPLTSTPQHLPDLPVRL